MFIFEKFAIKFRPTNMFKKSTDTASENRRSSWVNVSEREPIRKSQRPTIEYCEVKMTKKSQQEKKFS